MYKQITDNGESASRGICRDGNSEVARLRWVEELAARALLESSCRAPLQLLSSLKETKARGCYFSVLQGKGVPLSLSKAAPPLLSWSAESLPLWHLALVVTPLGPISLCLSWIPPRGLHVPELPHPTQVPSPLRPLRSSALSPPPSWPRSWKRAHHFTLPNSHSGPALLQLSPCSRS